MPDSIPNRSGSQGLSPATTINELLIHEGQEFVARIYQTLLGRTPDKQGLSYYLSRLERTHDKANIIYEIGTSDEARERQRIPRRIKRWLAAEKIRRLPIVLPFLRPRLTDSISGDGAPEKQPADLNSDSGLGDELRAKLREVEDRLAQSTAELEKFVNFDAAEYLRINKDVAGTAINPFEHFIRFGYAENRRTRSLSRPSTEPLGCEWLRNSSNVELQQDEERAAVDIVIPIFNGYHFLQPLFESILQNTDQPYRVILVDDCSTDPKVGEILETYVKKFPAATLIRNAANGGFVASANKGIAHASSDVLVLLNSDTEVPPRWLGRLIRPLRRDRKVASTTPFSNAATICSFPEPQADNALYLDLTAERIDAAFACVAPDGYVIEIPTGVGFCMAMRKSVVDEIGGFDRIYGRGYGEENDWCRRAARAGYRHVLVCNLFVYHKHGGSFPSEEKLRLVENNLRTLAGRYPDYHELVQEHIARDPAKALRKLVEARLRSEMTAGAVLVVDHDIGGGANSYRKDLVKSLTDDGRIVMVLLVRDVEDRGVTLSVHDGENAVQYAVPTLEDLSSVLRRAHIREVVYNNLVGSHSPLAVLAAVRNVVEQGALRLTVMMHDFYPICPSYTLLDKNGSYCGVPSDIGTCEKCVGAIPKDCASFLPDTISMRSWRSDWLGFLRLATEVRCFSESSRQIVSRAYPSVREKCTLVPHRVDFNPARTPHVERGETTHIGVIGGINFGKGRGVLENIVRYIEESGLPYKISVIGELDRPIRGVQTTGRYDRQALPDLIENLGINAILFPSIWPETFCYVVAEAMILELPIVCFDIGAPAERVRSYGRGMVLPTMEPAVILAGISDLLDRGSRSGVRPRLTRAVPSSSSCAAA